MASDPATGSETAEVVARLCGFERRSAGTDAERRAANALRERLEGRSRRAEIEPTYVHPQWSTVHGLHCVIAIAGSLAATVEPAVGFALVLAAATSTYLDLSGRIYLLRRLFFRRASQNVVARPRREAAEGARRVLLCANYDAPRTGAAYGPASARLLALAQRLSPLPLSPPRVLFWSMALLLPPLGARMAELDADWIAALQLPQTLVLIVCAFALFEISLSAPGPGANDNASGVAAVLAAVRRLDADPPANLEVDVLLAGAGETTMEGTRSFLRAHRKQLARDSTWFVGLDSVGRGSVRYLTGEGLVTTIPADPRLLAICAALGAGRDDDPAADAPRPLASPDATDAHLARAYGYPAVTICCRPGDQLAPPGRGSPDDLPATVNPEAVERAAELATAVIRVLDRELARDPGDRPRG